MDPSKNAAARVLVVDDETLLRMDAVDILEERGFHVVEAKSAAEALDILDKRSDVHVLFTDVNMPPGRDGIDLAHEVHRRWPAVRLIVTSGDRANADRQMPVDSHFIVKPYAPGTLTDKIDDVLDYGEAT